MTTSPISTETVLLLDRNAVALIKDAVAGKPQTDEKKRAALDALRALDVPEHSISPLLSIIEGERGREDTADEKAGCLEKETDVAGQFFRQANTDAAHLNGLKQVAAELFAGMKESLWNERANFLMKAAPLVVQKVPENKRQGVEGKLVQLANACGLAPNDGIVILFLACLYGSDAARKVIKPTRPNAYNVLSDLHVIPRLGMVKAVAGMLPRPVKVRFWTLDEGLFGVLSHVDIVESRFAADGELQMEVRYNPTLFPDLITGADDTSAAIAMLQRIAHAAEGAAVASEAPAGNDL